MPSNGSKAAKKASSPCAAGCDHRDRLSALSDAVLQHALGFLPVHEAVRTSVLVHCWRHTWKSMPHLRITGVEDLGSAEELSRFVSRLLLLRNPGLVLDQFELNLRGIWDADPTDVDLWIRHALLCKARVLHLHLSVERALDLRNQMQALVSPHLKMLRVWGAELGTDSILDFSGCPALEDLDVSFSSICTSKICSLSLKRLRIIQCNFRVAPDHRTHIFVPSLVWLQLEYCSGTTALLETMPSLEAASVRFGGVGGCTAFCSRACQNCFHNDDHIAGRVLLGGLSNATSLKLRASFRVFTFKGNFSDCPPFSKLKTLEIIDWCSVGDHNALLRFFKHTPTLEKLTLQLSQGEKTLLESEGNPPDHSIFSLRAVRERLARKTWRQLKTIEVKCEKIDERVQRTLKFLSTIGTCLKKFNIQMI